MKKKYYRDVEYNHSRNNNKRRKICVFFVVMMFLFAATSFYLFIEYRWALSQLEVETQKNTDSARQETDVIAISLIEAWYYVDSIGQREISDSLVYSLMADFEVQHPDIVFAQMRLESGNFSSELARINDNFFGMRQPYTRITTSNGEQGGYANYRNWAFSLLDYALWQRRYAYDLTEEEYLAKISSVYAEDTQYVNKIINLIH